jgi:hypothetical protein
MLQVCGFIGLYLRLAELSHATYKAQPTAYLASSQHLAWQQLAPLAVSAGLAMHVALSLHQACPAAIEELNQRLARQRVASHRALTTTSLLEIREFDARACRLYTDAHRVLARLTDMCDQPEALNATEALAQMGHVILQLTDICKSAYRTPTLTHALHDHTVLSSLRKAMEYSNRMSELCARSAGPSCSDGPVQDSRKFLGKASFNSVISAASAMQASIWNLDLWSSGLPPVLELGSIFYSSMPPALDLGSVPGSGSGVGCVPEQSSSSDGLLPWQQQYVDALLTFSPTSILQAFPPPPADPAEWATFYHDCCPVSLGKQPLALQVVEPWFQRVQLPHPPETRASAQEVAAYVSETKAQLGASFYALAPVAAAISHRPEPWVGAGRVAGMGGGVALPCLLLSSSASKVLCSHAPLCL